MTGAVADRELGEIPPGHGQRPRDSPASSPTGAHEVALVQEVRAECDHRVADRDSRRHERVLLSQLDHAHRREAHAPVGADTPDAGAIARVVQCADRHARQVARGLRSASRTVTVEPIGKLAPSPAST